MRGVATSIVGGAFIVGGSINLAGSANDELGFGLLFLGALIGALGTSIAHRR